MKTDNATSKPLTNLGWFILIFLCGLVVFSIAVARLTKNEQIISQFPTVTPPIVVTRKISMN